MASTDPIYPIGAGHPVYTGNFLPYIFSRRILEKFYDACLIAQIANTNYEGEIRGKGGEKVIIRQTPTITIRNYQKGIPLVVETPDTDAVELLIDKGKYYAFEIDDVDKLQMDLDYQDDWAKDAGQQMKISVDTDVLGNVYTDAHASNKGATAGRKSGDINLGASGSPLTMDKTNILDIIVDCETVLDEQNAPDDNRWLTIPMWAAGMIQKSDLKDASLSGDDKSLLRSPNGRLGMIGKFEIYKSNLLATTSDGGTVWNSIFGHKSGLAFAMQLIKDEIVRPSLAFQTVMKGLEVYGYKVTKPDVIGHLYVKKG